jgi:hypothetical protein
MLGMALDATRGERNWRRIGGGLGVQWGVIIVGQRDFHRSRRGTLLRALPMAFGV